MKHEMKRKGFTLVELLIVIVVIGILSAMMMLSSTEAVTSAKASNIVSNLRNLKTAALAYYVDHLDDLEDSTKKATDVKMSDLIKYLNSSPTKAFNFFDLNWVGVAYADGVTFDACDGTHATDGFTYNIGFVKREGSGTSPTLAEQKWYLHVVVDDTKVQEKLEGRAQSVGLLAGPVAADKEGAKYTKGSNSTPDVYYLIR